jgi:hypothetical protein
MDYNKLDECVNGLVLNHSWCKIDIRDIKQTQSYLSLKGVKNIHFNFLHDDFSRDLITVVLTNESAPNTP